MGEFDMVGWLLSGGGAEGADMDVAAFLALLQ